MSIQVGDINLVDNAINSEFRIGVLEKIIDKIIVRMPAGTLTQADIDKIRDGVLEEMKKKYPNMGLGPK